MGRSMQRPDPLIGMFDFNATHHAAALYLDPDTGNVLKAAPR